MSLTGYATIQKFNLLFNKPAQLSPYLRATQQFSYFWSLAFNDHNFKSMTFHTFFFLPFFPLFSVNTSRLAYWQFVHVCSYRNSNSCVNQEKITPWKTKTCASKNNFRILLLTYFGIHSHVMTNILSFVFSFKQIICISQNASQVGPIYGHFDTLTNNYCTLQVYMVGMKSKWSLIIGRITSLTIKGNIFYPKN